MYDANKLAKLVETKKKMKNWLDYYQLKYERNPSERPTGKVRYVDNFNYYYLTSMRKEKHLIFDLGNACLTGIQYSFIRLVFWGSVAIKWMQLTTTLLRLISYLKKSVRLFALLDL